MNTKLAALLLVPALTLSAGALASRLGNQGQDRHDGQSHSRSERHVNRSALRERASDRSREQDYRQQPRYREPPVRQSRPPSHGGSGGGRDPHPGGGGSDHGHGGHHGGHGHHGGWHGQHEDWHGHSYWRADIRFFPRYDWGTWRRGYWYHGWYGSRWGWWWLAGGVWFYYPAPIYPYPDPYVPGTVTIVNTQPSPPQPPAQAPAVQYWYHCTAPDGYYPYVPECPGGWTKVPVTPPSVTSQAVNAPPPATH